MIKGRKLFSAQRMVRLQLSFSASTLTISAKDQPYRSQTSILMGSYGRLDHNIESDSGDETKYIVRMKCQSICTDDYKMATINSIHSNWERWNTDLALGLEANR